MKRITLEDAQVEVLVTAFFFLKMHKLLNALNLSILNLELCVYDIDNWVLYYFVN